MIKNKKLLIDADCPLCRLYGNGFQKLQFIDSQTVVHYQNAAPDYCWAINLERAKSEIAFLDEKTGATSYGIDAFIEIIGSRSRIIRQFMNWAPIHFILRKLYRFVSFNRKVIAESPSHSKGISCAPAVHRGYRWAYVLITAFFTGFVMSKFGNRLFGLLGFHQLPYLEYAICLGQILWQGAAIRITSSPKTLDYLGNMSTVSMVGALLMIPVILIEYAFNLGAPYLLISFAIVVLIMINMHIARCRNLGISNRLTISWVGYRALILLGILTLNFAS